jgi:hypothetical protein
VPPQSVTYSVRGATFSLRLSDGRIAVNCDSKVNWTEWSMNPRRSCRIPTGNQFDVQFSGEQAKLLWHIGVNNEKAISETYHSWKFSTRRGPDALDEGPSAVTCQLLTTSCLQTNLLFARGQVTGRHEGRTADQDAPFLHGGGDRSTIDRRHNRQRQRMTPSSSIAYSSHSTVVSGNANVNCCRTHCDHLAESILKDEFLSPRCGLFDYHSDRADPNIKSWW